MDANIIAERFIGARFTAEEALVVIFHLGGEGDWLGERIKASGLLPENHEEIAFEIQETLRKLHRKIQP